MSKFFSFTFFLILVCSSPLFASLDDTSLIDREKTVGDDFSLKSFNSCENMDEVLSRYLKKSLYDQLSLYGDMRRGFGGGMEPWMGGGGEEALSSMPSVASPVADSSSISSSKVSMSETNVQITGVDESDVIKTDGTYIYYVSNTQHEDGFQYVHIVRASDMALIKRIKLPQNYNTNTLYLADGFLTVLANRWIEGPMYQGIISRSQNTDTVVVVYDVRDPSRPELKRFYTVSGHLAHSRRNGDYLYVLSQDSISLNIWWYRSDVIDKLDIQKYIDNEFDAVSILPKTIEIKKDENPIHRLPWNASKLPYSYKKWTVWCQEIEYLLPEKPDNLWFLTLSIIPLKGNGDIVKKVIWGDVSQFFMSLESLYIVSSHWNQWGDFSCPPGARCMMPFFRSEQNSLIHKFQIKSGSAKYVYSVMTPGMPLSKYAMHEKDWILITAQQKDWSTNGVDIFAIDPTGKLISKLENVGAKERFQSSRYVNDRLYLVTFEQVDPLFVIDISQPKSMKILGELIMPGYSTYLHPYDDNHLIGLWYDTQTNTWWGTTNAGLKVDLYDVSDVRNPKQKYSKVYGGIGSSSEALTDPRSLVWDDAKKTLLFPAQLLDQNMQTYENLTAWQWLLALKIDKNAGITEEARISHIDMTGISEKRKTECAKYDVKVEEKKCYTHLTTGKKTCIDPMDNPANPRIPTYCFAEYDDSSYIASHFWDYVHSYVQRGIYIKNTLYTASPYMIQAHTYGGGYGFVGKLELGK